MDDRDERARLEAKLWRMWERRMSASIADRANLEDWMEMGAFMSNEALAVIAGEPITASPPE